MDMSVSVEPVEENRTEPKINKGWANLVPARKGEVRNPRGRPKKDYDLAEKAQKHAETALNTLVSVMTNEEASPAARVGAAAEILDRGFGKAPADLKVNHQHNFSEEFEALIRSITTRRTEKVIEHVEENSSEADLS